MTVVRENTASSPGAPLTPLAARLEQLLRRAITVDQFEADMVSSCEAHPDEVWNLLALLDQYHRLERLPTELYRALKASIDRYGLARREPYTPYVSQKTKPAPEQGTESAVQSSDEPSMAPSNANSPTPPPPIAPEPAAPASASQPAPAASAPVPASPPVAAPAPMPAPPSVAASAPLPAPAPAAAAPVAAPPIPPAGSFVPPAAAQAARFPASELPKVPSAGPDKTPFRHLLDDEEDDEDDQPVSVGRPVFAGVSVTRPGSRYAAPVRRSQSSKARRWLLPALLLAVIFGAAAWLKQGQGSVDMLAGPEDVAQQASNAAAAPTPPAEPGAATPVPAPSFSTEPAPTSAARARAPVAAATASQSPMPAASTTAPASPASAPPSPAEVLAAPAAAPVASRTSPASAPPSPAEVLAAPAAPRSSPAAVPRAPAQAPAAPVARAAPVEATRATGTPAAATSGPSTIEFATDNYTVRPGDSAARILVRRSGNVNGDLSFVWWTENATAVADVDYVAWGHRTEKIPAGRNSTTLLVPIINDSTRTSPRRFQVVIGSAENGARLGGTTHATVQLTGSS